MRRTANLVRTSLFAALAMAALAPATAHAGEPAIAVADAYARAPSPSAPAGAAYIDIVNHAETDDRLLTVASDAAARTELHTVETDDQGMTRMVHMAEGIEVPAGATLDMGRGGIHVMLMGLSAPLEQGNSVEVVLTFRDAGEVTVTVPVDLERDDAAGTGGHGMMKMDGSAGN